jgi:hypothetical protein
MVSSHHILGLNFCIHFTSLRRMLHTRSSHTPPPPPHELLPKIFNIHSDVVSKRRTTFVQRGRKLYIYLYMYISPDTDGNETVYEYVTQQTTNAKSAEESGIWRPSKPTQSTAASCTFYCIAKQVCLNWKAWRAKWNVHGDPVILRVLFLCDDTMHMSAAADVSEILTVSSFTSKTETVEISKTPASCYVCTVSSPITLK